MADSTVSALPAASALDGTELYYGVQSSADAKVTGLQIKTLAVAVTPNSQSAAYPTVLLDAGKCILHPTADNNPRTFTIADNATVAYPLGTVIVFVNQINTLTIAIAGTDTMTLAGGTTTGNRTLAAVGIASAIKVATTSWVISGTGLT